ncbi:glycosyltransferase [Sorangium sp. So ce260]|uniref:glycosyltransferase n=1 Tax=Sorangium sp. So ce260 TaxID=3133291 RepID=UPI003F5EE015
MRVWCTILPGSGHFHPVVPTARALKAAGHDVSFACPENYREMVESNGFPLVPVGMRFEQVRAEHPAFMERLGKMSASPSSDLTAIDAMFAEMFIGVLARRMTEDLLERARTGQPDLIVRDAMEFGGYVAAEALGIPHATISVGLFTPIERQQQSLGPSIDKLREAFGLPADPGLAMLYRYLYLSFVAPSLQGGSGQLPPTACSLHPEIFDQSGTESLPAWASSLGSRPVIYVTMGTVIGRLTNVFSPILDALRDEPFDVIVTVGRDQDPAALGPQPPNVHIERYIPQTLIFPRCDLVIMHGGFNSMQSSLYHGLPMLCIPLLFDQPINAAICTKLGVAQTLTRGELSPDRIKRAVRELLENPSYGEKASLLQREMQSLPKLDKAVELLESLARTKAPQLAAR